LKKKDKRLLSYATEVGPLSGLLAIVFSCCSSKAAYLTPPCLRDVPFDDCLFFRSSLVNACCFFTGLVLRASNRPAGSTNSFLTNGVAAVLDLIRVIFTSLVCALSAVLEALIFFTVVVFLKKQLFYFFLI
jgi:hypothetical protein